MNVSVAVEDSVAVAAMTPPRSKSPFNRAHLIVRSGDSIVLRARTYTNDTRRVEGLGLTAEDMQSLIDVGQAIKLPKLVPLVSGAALWVLRRNLPRRDRALQDLRINGVLIHSPLEGPDHCRLCLVNEGHAVASVLLDRWRDHAVQAAKNHAKNGEWERAEIEAETAQAVCQGLNPEVLAVLCLAYEHRDRKQRAQGILAMARRSRGDAFEAQLGAALRRLRSTVDTSRRDAALRAALRQLYPDQNLDKQMTARLAA